MKNGNKNIVIFTTLLVLVFLGILVWNKPKNANPKQGAEVSSTVPFLLPNLPPVQHIHPQLEIYVDGAKETIPANIGLGLEERAIHTHDDSGTIHVEAQDSRSYTLGDFFSVWEKPVMRNGYDLEMTVDGKQSQEYGKLVLKDLQQIVLKYTKSK